MLDAAVACLGHNPYASVSEIAQAAGVDELIRRGQAENVFRADIPVRWLTGALLPATSALPNGAANRPPGEWLRAGVEHDPCSQSQIEEDPHLARR